VKTIKVINEALVEFEESRKSEQGGGSSPTFPTFHSIPKQFLPQRSHAS